MALSVEPGIEAGPPPTLKNRDTMNCLDCHPHTTPAVAICGRCGAGICAEHVVETEDHLTFTAVINRVVEVSPSVRHLRCTRCAAAERAQAA